MDERALLERITANPEIFGGKPIIRGHRMAVEHVLQVLATGISLDEFFRHYPWLEPEDVRACLLYAAKLVGRERVDIAVSIK